MKNLHAFLRKSRSMLGLICCAALVFGAMQLAKVGEAHFDSLTVEGIENRRAVLSGQANFSNLPLIHAQAPKVVARVDAIEVSPLDIDAAFLPPVAIDASAPAERVMPDNFKSLPHMIRVSGVSDQGAMIAGEYVPFGSPLKAYSYQGADGRVVTPTLVGRSGNHLVIREGGPGSNRTERIPL